ncbi:MAG: iron-sulfur cluster repair protein YtfE, partial [Limnobaculum xujianqingii]
KHITNNLTPPAEACNTWRALYSSTEEFITDLMEHIHLENNILFPRALANK